MPSVSIQEIYLFHHEGHEAHEDRIKIILFIFVSFVSFVVYISNEFRFIEVKDLFL